MDERRKNLIKIAHYYYVLGYTQAEIAKIWGTSRKTVNVFLKKAREEGIVEIRINGYDGSDLELEQKLISLLGLEDAVVIEEDGETPAFNRQFISYIDKLLYDGIYVGINYGNTLARAFAQPVPSTPKDINVVQLGGGANIHNIAYKAEEITINFANSFGGQIYNLYMPNILESKKLKEMLEQEKTFQSILALYKKLDAIIVAVGTVDRGDILVREGYIDENEYRSLKRKSAVCDICFRFLDDQGNIVDHELEERVTGISTEDLKKVPMRICVSYGAQKVTPILAAIRGGYINRLVTDRATASQIIDSLPSENKNL